MEEIIKQPGFESEIDYQVEDFYNRMRHLSQLYQYASIHVTANRVRREYQGHQDTQKTRRKPAFYNILVKVLGRIFRRSKPLPYQNFSDIEIHSVKEKHQPVIIDVHPVSKEDERNVDYE